MRNAPLLIGVAALMVIVGTLYTFFDSAILASGYVLLLIAAFFNQNRMLSFLNRRVHARTAELAEMNDTLESRVSYQVEEIERLAGLKRFLPGEVADLIMTEGKESLLEGHRRYIACLFCDIRRFTSMTEAMEPEDVMACCAGSTNELDGSSSSIAGPSGIALATESWCSSMIRSPVTIPTFARSGWPWTCSKRLPNSTSVGPSWASMSVLASALPVATRLWE
jgi:hypothetical protein